MADGLDVPVNVDTGDSDKKLSDLIEQVEKLTDVVGKMNGSLKIVSAEAFAELGERALKLVEFVGRMGERFIDVARTAGEMGEAIQGGAIQAGVSAQRFQELSRAAESANVPISLISRASVQLQRGLFNANPAFEKFGINVAQIRALKPDEQFTAVATAIKSIEDPAKRAAASQALLRDRGGQLAKFIQSDFNTAMKSAVTLSNEEVESLAKLDDAFDLVNGATKDIKTQFIAAIGESANLQTVVQFVGEAFRELAVFVKENKGAITELVNKGIIFLVDAIIGGLIPAFSLAVTGVQTLAEEFVRVQSFGQKTATVFLAVADVLSGNLGVTEFGQRIEDGFRDANTSAKEGFGAIDRAATLAQLGIAKVNDKVLELRSKLVDANPEMEKHAEKQAAVAQAATRSKEAIKSEIEALKEELKVFQEREKLRLLQQGFGQGADVRARQEAESSLAVAQKQFEVTLKELEAKRLKKDITADELKSIDKQVTSAKELFQVTRAITEETLRQRLVQENRKVIDDRLKADADAIKSAIELQHVNDSLLAGEQKITAEHQKRLAVINAEFERQKIALATQAARGDVTQAQAAAQLAALNDQHGAQVQLEDDQTALAALQANTLLLTIKTADASDSIIAKMQTWLSLSQGLLSNFGKVGGAIGGALGSISGSVKQFQDLKGVASAAGGFLKGGFTSALGQVGAAVSIAQTAFSIGKSIVGVFKSDPIKKAQNEAGRELGFGISRALGEEIKKNADKLGLSIQNAALLSLPKAIEESGKSAHAVAGEVFKLFDSIQSGAVPAAEGVQALDESFRKLTSEAEKAGTVGDKTITQLLKKARALGQETPEMKAFVDAQLAAATAGVGKFIGALSALTGPQVADLGAEAGIIFGANFSALVSEKGIVAAVDAMQDSFGMLRETLSKSLDEATVAQILAPFAAAFDTLGNEELRPIFEGIDGIAQAMKGLANAGFLDVGAFKAMQSAAGKLFDDAIEGGADSATALRAIAPEIQAAISAASQFGIPLDANTQRLKDLAEQNGIAFKTDPMTKAADAIGNVAIALDKVFHLGLGLEDQFKNVNRAAQEVAATVGQLPTVGGPGGVAPPGLPRPIQINPTVEIREIPLQSSQSVAGLQRIVAETVTSAVEDQVAGLRSALQGI